jgi:hypothetical protein
LGVTQIIYKKKRIMHKKYDILSIKF